MVPLAGPGAKFFEVGVTRVQLEQDSGKTVTTIPGVSLVDLDRAGRALVEVVMEPHVRTAHQAASTVEAVRAILAAIGTCDGRMEDGALRCDLNVSVAPIGEEGGCSEEGPFTSSLPPGVGHRVEVKNLNSLRQVIAATEYEVLRQARDALEGTPTTQETRTFDVVTGATRRLRGKEGAADYRFMPEPDLPPLVLDERSLGVTLENLIASMPELPHQAEKRLVREYEIEVDAAVQMSSDRDAMELFEGAVREALREAPELGRKNAASSAANFVINDLVALSRASHDLREGPDDGRVDTPIGARQLGVLVAMVRGGELSTGMARKILGSLHGETLGPDVGPRKAADTMGLRIISGVEELRGLCAETVAHKKHAKQLLQYAEGGRAASRAEKYFMGKVMSASRGNAHPERAAEVLRETLDELTIGG